MKQPTWEEVAHTLASRLMYAAYCEKHEVITENCPFCNDIAAYEAYLAKCKASHRVPVQTSSLDHAPLVDVDDLRRGR